MGVGLSRASPKVKAIKIEGQWYDPEPSRDFICSFDLGYPRVSLVAFRGTISCYGRAFPVCRLSFARSMSLMCVPASIEVIGHEWGRNSSSSGLTAIAFEFGSRARTIDPISFSGTQVRSLCVPASVTSFGQSLQPFPPSLFLLTFESGSRIRRLECPLFGFQGSFMMIFPHSLEYIDARLFFRFARTARRHPISETYAVESENPHFAIAEFTLMHFSRTSVMRYFGSEFVPQIDSGIEEFGPDSFSATRVTSLAFDDMSSLRVIGRRAFADCRYLESITIPPSVRVIDEGAFRDSSVQQVRFATRSQLQMIQPKAFYGCHYLQPVDVPASARIRGLFQVVVKVCYDEAGLTRTRVWFITPRSPW
jgi:hypothetical protein